MTEFGKMPEEMTLEILSRLPPKCLMRFKRVHKSWCTLINNPSFVAKHLANAVHNNSSICLLLKRLIVKDADFEEKDMVFSLLNIRNDIDNDNDERDIHYVVEDMTKGQFIGLKVLESAWIVGHCDGIICLADLSNVIILLNPAIMESKLVTAEPYGPDTKTLNLGFGYDPKSKSYKVVNVSSVGVDTYCDENIIFNPPIVNVYSTSGSDSWRQIRTDSLETETTMFGLDSFQIYFEGFCYWTGREQLKEYTSDEYDYDGENLRQVFISFDMGDEVFHYTLFPDCLYESRFCWYDVHLILWNTTIALVCGDGELIHPESLGLWVMADFDGIKGSWIKHFTFGEGVDIVTPLLSRNNEEILMDSEERHIVSYNLDTEKLKYLPIHNMDTYDNLHVVAYVTSIVGILGSNMTQSRGTIDRDGQHNPIVDPELMLNPT